jgi:hypothetical protein
MKHNRAFKQLNELSHANAALISAAPEMFEAFSILLSDIEKCNGDITLEQFRNLTSVKQRIERAKQALKQARGES